MPARVPRNNGPARRSAQLVLALLIALGACVAGPATALADPVRPKATPLAVVAAGAPTRCPSAGEVDGEQLTTLLSRTISDDNFSTFFAFTLLQVLPTPAVVLCDPDLAKTNQPLGAFGGATHHELSSDVAFAGLRALGAPPEGVADSELVPGDRVELPTASPRAQLTVVVATTTGARSAHVPSLGAPQATAVRVEGTLAAPVVVVERAGGDPTRVAVTPPPAAAVRVQPRLRGREIRFNGTAAPGTIVTASAGDDDGDVVIAASSGRFKGLSVRVGPRRRAISISLLSLARRQAFEVSCVARWSKARKLADKISCKAIKAARATRAVRQAIATSAPLEHAAATPVASASTRVVASGAAAPTTAEASLSRLATYSADEVASLAGDLNGDGRPETLLNNAFDETPRPRLVVSKVGGTATTIPFRTDRNDFEFVVETVPDLDGDGRDELSGGNGVFITDALAAPALPARIDVRALRPTSPRDLDLGVENRDNLFSSLLTASEPLGTVADGTGDGRPELVVDSDGISAIFPSQAVVPGIRSRLAQVFPLAWLDELKLEDLSDEALDAALSGRFIDDMQATSAAATPGSVVVGGRFVSLAAADTTIAPTRPRTFLLRTFGGGSVPTATTSFSATGVPLLLDHDPASGDSLVALFQRTSCGKRRCLDRLLRLNAAGQAVSVIAVRRSEDQLSATFISDGPDGDSAVDAALWRGFGRSVGGVESAGDNGSIAVLTSAQTGSRKLASLPVLARGGKPVQALGRISSSVLPNGSRWLAAPTSERGRKRTGTYALLGQKP